MRDLTLEDTAYFDFTTRAFATGIPTVLAGTPVLSVLEENNATPITAGVSVSVDRASVVGLNMATVVATAANGYESGKGYSVYISTGTVGGVSVVGEKVAEFTIEASAALTAVNALNDVAATDIVSAGAITTSSGAVSTVTTVGTTTTNTDMRGTDNAALASVLNELTTAMVLSSSAITVSSQTAFIIPVTDDAVDNDAYIGAVAVFIDQTDPNQKSYRMVTDYVASTRVVTVNFAPDFTIATGDTMTLLVAATATTVWDRVLTGATHNIASSAGRRLRALSGLIIEDGTAQSATANTIVLAVGDITIDDQFRRAKIVITAGTGAGQEAIITSSVASTDTLTVTPAWLVNPDATSEYEILPAQAHATVRNGGYDNGLVYVDSASGNTGQQVGVDGTSTNPLDNLTDAYAIGVVEQINNFFVEGGSALTLPSNSDNKVFVGDNYTVALNGQEISGISFLNASLSGVGIATAADSVNLRLCGLGTVTLPPTNGINCAFFGTFTIGVAGSFTFGESSTVFDLPFVVDFAAVGATSFHLTGWLGGDVEVRNMLAGDVFHMTGNGDVTIAASCTSGTVELSGNVVLTDNGSNTVTRLGDLNEIKGATFDGTTDTLEDIRNAVTTVQSDTDDIQTRIPAALVSGRMDANMSAINDDNTSAVNLALSTLAIEEGAAIAGTLSSTQMSTDLTEVTDEQYRRGLLIWTSGVLLNSRTVITAYNGTTKVLTYNATETGESPSATDTFVIL